MENLWKQIKGNKPVFVEFYASWCPHCQKMMPVIERLKNKENERLQVLQYDIDMPANKPLLKYYQVQAVPLMMLFNGGEQQWRWSGEIEENELMQTVERLI